MLKPTETVSTDGTMTQKSSAGPGDDSFLAELGQRVRKIRAVRGMSRKVLSEVSHISERYIAQMESGQGNASIILLRRIALATGVPLDELVSEDGAPTGDRAVIRDLLKSASAETLAQVKAVLTGASNAQGSTPAVHVNRVALIGLRGAGKSTLGKMVAEKLGWTFIELNREIEREHGLSITEIFSLYGQDGYRRLEQITLKRLLTLEGPLVLATGGGIVADPITFDMLLSSFFTVWIKASPKEHMARVRKQGDLRPMGNDRSAMDELETILSSREPLYGRARAQLDTSAARWRKALRRSAARSSTIARRIAPSSPVRPALWHEPHRTAARARA